MHLLFLPVIYNGKRPSFGSFPPPGPFLVEWSVPRESGDGVKSSSRVGTLVECREGGVPFSLLVDFAIVLSIKKICV
jgi:hypothetical protein